MNVTECVGCEMTSNMALQFEAEIGEYNKLRSDMLRIKMDVPLSEMPLEYYRLPTGTKVIVAVALYDVETGEQIPPESPPKKERARFEEHSNTKQAALLCKRTDFQEFIAYQYKTLCASEEDAKSWVRKVCNVKSRAELGQPGKDVLWDSMRRQFEQWQTDKIAEALQR